MKKVLEIVDLSKSYKKNNKKIQILKDLNFSFETNKFYCIYGKSGIGKTTLIEILGLLNNPDSGDIYINNVCVSRMNEIEKAKTRKNDIGFIFQSFYLIPTMNAMENVMLPLYLEDKSFKSIKSTAINLLKDLDLEERILHFPKELSGGEQQRVAIARALANDPEIILADEPTGSLDNENEKRILDILSSLAKNGKCVIVVSHSDLTKKYANEILEINDQGLRRILNDKND